MKNLIGIVILLSFFYCHNGTVSTEPEIDGDCSVDKEYVKTNDSILLKINFIDSTKIADYSYQIYADQGEIHQNDDHYFLITPDTPAVINIAIDFSYKQTKHKLITKKVQVYEQLIVLKADDMQKETPQWNRFISFLMELKIPMSIGVIGSSLNSSNEQYFQYLKSLVNSGYVELWNHGYYHLTNQKDSNGNFYSEFQNTTYEFQKKSLELTNFLAQKNLGITFRAFGAPGNRWDDNTLQIVNENPDIKIWFYGKRNTIKFYFDRTLDMEFPCTNPSFNDFLSQYNRDEELICYQIHPNHWNEDQLKEFNKIIYYLIENKVTFIKPYDYFTKFISLNKNEI